MTVPPTADLLLLIRPAVREQSPYLVSGSTETPAVKLNQNESPFDLPKALKEELVQTFLSIPFNRYPKEQPLELRDQLAAHLDYPPEGLLIGNGSNEITYTLGLCLIEPGRHVVLPSPLFSLYEKVVSLYEGTLVAVPPKPDLHFDVEALSDAIEKHNPSITVLASPNNPTGLSLSFEEIERLASISNGFLVVDEAYHEFSSQRSAFELLPSYPNLIILRTFSKAMGLAGIRIGYLAAHPDVVREFMKSRIPFAVDRIAETVALTLLDKPEILADHVDYLVRERDQLISHLQAMPDIDVIPSDANFVLFKSPQNPGLLMKKLSSHGVVVRNMEGYPELAGYLRVNAGSSEENKVFLSALELALQE